MLVKDVMTADPGYCMPEDSVIRAAQLMKDMDAGIVPIIASGTNKKLLGVVTDRDLCLAVIAEGIDPRTMTLQECMSMPVVTTRPDEDIEQAVNLMRDNQIRRVPVVNGSGELQGMVSFGDLYRRSDVSSAKTHEALSTVSAPSSGTPHARRTVKNNEQEII